MLPRTTHLTQLAVCFPDGWSHDGSCYDAEKAITSSLLHLQELRVGAAVLTEMQITTKGVGSTRS